MDEAPEIRVDFQGLSGWTGPATWGQRAIWRSIRWLGSDDAYFNLGRTVAVGSGLPVPDVVEVIRLLFARHEALRTRFAAGVDAEPVQILDPAGVLPVRWTELAATDAATVAAAAEDVRTALAARRFDLEAELPVRFGAVGRAGIVYALIPVVSHIAADGSGVDALAEDLRRLCAAQRRHPGRVPPRPVGRSPREQVAFEMSAAMLRRDAAARTHARRILGVAPPALLPAPTPTADVEPFRRLLLEGGPLDAASRALAIRWNRTPAAVVLAGYAAELAEATGHERIALKVIAGNRSDPLAAGAVGAFAQDGILCLRAGGRSLSDLAGQASIALLEAARHARFDPRAMDRETAAASVERGIEVQVDCYFNDFRGTAGPGRRPDSADAVPGNLGWDASWPRQDSGLFFALSTTAGLTTASLIVDTRRFAPERAERLLRGLERAVASAAMSATNP